MSRRDKSICLGFLAGALGGALGTVVLNAFQAGSLKTTESLRGEVQHFEGRKPAAKELMTIFEKAHSRTAEVVAGAAGVDLTREQRKAGAPVVEFAFGILCAGVYGAIAGRNRAYLNPDFVVYVPG